jgi:hypothetical protein
MKNILKTLFLIAILSSCITSKTIVFDDNILNENKEQVLFFDKKPLKDYDEKGIVVITLIPKKEGLIFGKFKEEMKKNNYDAIINIKSEMFVSSYFTASMNYIGLGIKYKK